MDNIERIVIDCDSDSEKPTEIDKNHNVEGNVQLQCGIVSASTSNIETDDCLAGCHFRQRATVTQICNKRFYLF